MDRESVTRIGIGTGIATAIEIVVIGNVTEIVIGTEIEIGSVIAIEIVIAIAIVH